MNHIKLPISKSIANRLLLLQAIHGDPLMRVSSDMPDDVIVLHDALEALQTFKQRQTTSNALKQAPLVLNLKNCGTALRFLQVHLEKCYPGDPITLTGDPRLMERDGKPTSQTTSARILHGESIPVEPGESPYITMSRRMVENYSIFNLQSSIEADWSAAAFWYEYIAIHGGELLLEGLQPDSLQGDRIVADIYAEHFGVQTEFVPEGTKIIHSSLRTSFVHRTSVHRTLTIDFSNCPDLYPAVALTCERLGLELQATGIERLRFKESDRLEAVRLHEVRNDHRMAMSLMVADYPVSESDQQCIAKSYPDFVHQFTTKLLTFHGANTTTTRKRDVNDTITSTGYVQRSISHITPIRGVNDDNLGKKHALSKLIHAAHTEYVWLHDDDVILPPATVNIQSAPNGHSKDTKDLFGNADLIILPLRMETPSLEGRVGVGLSLQIAEYAAIQELTMRTAKRGHAVMCSGANLIVRREAWLACEADLHPEIPSGDDMFLLEAMKKRGYKISVIDEPDFTAVVRPAPTWRAFIRQRMRWAGKAPKYTDPDILRCGALIVAANLFQLLCPLILLIKFPIEYSLIKKRITLPFREGQGVGLFFIALLLELLYPIYILFSLVGGLFRQKKW